jgi:hypothetical protein
MLSGRGRIKASKRHWLLGALSFGVGRGSSFLFPIAFAAVSPVDEYGRFELSLALATFCSIPLDLGIAGSLPYFVLRRKRLIAVSAAALYALIVQVAGFAAASSLMVFGAQREALICLFASILMAQGVAGSTARSTGRPKRAFLFDSALYTGGLIGLGFFLVAARATPRLTGLSVVWFAVAVLLMGSHIATVREHKSSLAALVRRLRPMFTFGVRIALGTLMATALVLMGRGLSGVLLGDESAGVFGFYFRVASLPLIVHGFLQTMLFKDVYGRTSADAIRLMNKLLIMVAAASVGVLAVFFVVAPNLGSFAAFAPLRNVGLLAIMCSTVVTWAATAQQELLINQEALALKMVFPLAGIIALFGAISLTLSQAHVLTLGLFVALHNLAMLSYLMAQAIILRTRAIDITPTLIIALAGTCMGQAANYAG